MVSNQHWVICRMYGKTGIRGQEYGKENHAGSMITDLLDTLRANLDYCVGMAANMIGVKKNIIAVAAGPLQKTTA